MYMHVTETNPSIVLSLVLRLQQMVHSTGCCVSIPRDAYDEQCLLSGAPDTTGAARSTERTPPPGHRVITVIIIVIIIHRAVWFAIR